MRMLLKMNIPAEAGNAAIKSGALPATMARLQEDLKPEAAFFTVDSGMRTAYFVFDMKEESGMPAALEPAFSLGSNVTLSPAMNAEDLRKGLSSLG